MSTQICCAGWSGPWPAVIFYVDAVGVRPETESMADRLASSGTMEVYPEVAHGFCVQGLPVYNKDASERHWTELLGLFDEMLPVGAPAS